MNANVRLILMGLVAAGAVAGTVYLYSSTWVFDQNLELCKNGSGQAKIDACTQVIASGKANNDELADAYSNRGIAYSSQEKFDRAQPDYEAATRLAPDNFAFLSGRAGNEIELGRYPQAIKDFDVVIARKPNAYFYNGRCWARAVWGRELDKALADCNRSLKLSPSYDAAFDSRALVEFRLGQYDKAVGDDSQVLSDNPDLAPSLYIRGLARLRLGNLKDGNADIAAAKKADPKIAETYGAYGVTP